MVTVTQQIVMLWDEGYSTRDIQRLTGKPRTTVWTVLHRHRPDFKDLNRQRQAPPAVVTQPGDVQ